MTFLSKNKTFKIIKLFVLLFILLFILILIQNIRNLNSVEEEAKSYLQSARIFNLKNALLKILHKETFLEKEQEELSDKTMLFHSKHQESCLKKYLFHVQRPDVHSRKVSKLVFQNASQAYMFTSFHKITKLLDVKACIIEPPILHCLLPTKYQELLAKRNFTLSNLTGSQHVITFGILGDDVPILQKEENIHEFRNGGLQPYFVHVPLAPWMKEDKEQFKDDKYTSHIFYTYYTWTFHVVVFYKRNNYLWHAALKLDENPIFLPQNNLLYVNYNSAYENFNFDLVLKKSHKIPSIYIPSSPHYFLFQIPSSRFLECNPSRAMLTENVKVNTNSSLDFNKKTLTALRELKIFFQNMMMNFWIFSGTLLGWYRQCGVIPYTTNVDFGAWKSEIDDLDNITTYFRQNKKLFLVERMGFLEEALEFQLRSKGLRVNLFFLYKTDNGTWASGHQPSKGYYFRYHYPLFTLCSAELLQEKVQVPCQAEDVILIEYGKKWMHPVSSWDDESSIHNRGPNIYWNEKRRPKAFQSY